jgi:hypothetical protein
VLAVEAGAGVAGQADQGTQVALDPAGLGGVAEQVGGHGGQLGRRLVGGVGLQDPGLGLDHLAQGPEGHALAVGQGASLAPGGQLRLGVDGGQQLGDQPALADPGGTDEGDLPGGAVGAHPGQGVAEPPQLGLAPDQRSAAARAHVDPEAGDRL